MRKVYLGDAVYAQSNSFGGINLTTENGITTTNTIYLEPEVLAALDAFRAAVARDTTTTAEEREP